MTIIMEPDTSWLSKNQTLEEANGHMQKSISMVTYPANVPCIWVADLEATNFHSQQSHNVLDDDTKMHLSHRMRKRRARSEPNEFFRLRNSFMQYRNLVKQCFSDDPTQPIISKRIAELWATESPDMRFFCERNAAIESRIITIESMPPDSRS